MLVGIFLVLALLCLIARPQSWQYCNPNNHRKQDVSHCQCPGDQWLCPMVDPPDQCNAFVPCCRCDYDVEISGHSVCEDCITPPRTDYYPILDTNGLDAPSQADFCGSPPCNIHCACEDLTLNENGTNAQTGQPFYMHAEQIVFLVFMLLILIGSAIFWSAFCGAYWYCKVKKAGGCPDEEDYEDEELEEDEDYDDDYR